LSVSHVAATATATATSPQPPHHRRCHAINSATSTPLPLSLPPQVLLERGAHDEALRALEIATQLEPNNTQAQFLRANVLVAMERYPV
jgi:predicted Zn-dependent protease